MELDENALLVLTKRYLVKDEAGSLTETPDGLVRRVASAVAAVEEHYRTGRRREMEEAFSRMMVISNSFPTRPP